MGVRGGRNSRKEEGMTVALHGKIHQVCRGSKNSPFWSHLNENCPIFIGDPSVSASFPDLCRTGPVRPVPAVKPVTLTGGPEARALVSVIRSARKVDESAAGGTVWSEAESDRR